MKNTKKNHFFRQLLVSGLLIFLGNSSHAKDLIIATDSGASGSRAGDAIEEWARIIKTNTDNKLESRVFFQNQLGGQQEVFDLHMMGEVDIMLNWPMTSYSERLSVLYAPYLFLDWNEALQAYRPGGWMYDIVDDIYSSIGLKFLGAWPEGFNGFATTGECLTAFNNKDNYKLRVQPVFPMAETVGAMGFNTATIDWAELYTSIQTGLVDGDAGNVIYWDYEYFRDVLDCYVQTKQQFITGVLSINLESWNKLSKDEKSAVEDGALEIMETRFSNAQEHDEKYVNLWQEDGNDYLELSAEELFELAQKVRNKVWPEMESPVGEGFMIEIRGNSTNIK